ncbi:MAG TPA: hypothetical protein VGR00_04395, partial [Thermoanaerobaculia bacterium]|nr:hypothetical protein [Thermoanaerobaculia bacterium]
PPLYTSNKLTLAKGFEAPAVLPKGVDLARLTVGTDASLALKTRKGTGYYKVPSLRGLWYRGLLEHSGSVSSLEEWFDPTRRRDDHVPGGWKGPGISRRAVPGHPYGLDLTDSEKKVLIRFLKTL